MTDQEDSRSNQGAVPEVLTSPGGWSDSIFMHNHVIPFIKYKRPTRDLWFALCKYAATVLFGVNAPTPDLFFGVLGGFYLSEGNPLLSDACFIKNGEDFKVLEIDDIDMSKYNFGQYQSTTMDSMKLSLPNGTTVDVKVEELLKNTGALFIALGLTVKWTGCGEFNNLQKNNRVIKTLEDMVEVWNDAIEPYRQPAYDLQEIAGKIVTIYYLIIARLVGKGQETVYNTIVTTATAKCKIFTTATFLLKGNILPPSKNAMKRLTVSYDKSVFIRPLAMAIASLELEENVRRKNAKRTLLRATCLLSLCEMGAGLLKWVHLAAERNDTPVGQFLKDISDAYSERFSDSINSYYDFMKVMDKQFSWPWAHMFDPTSVEPLSTKRHLKFVFFCAGLTCRANEKSPVFKSPVLKQFMEENEEAQELLELARSWFETKSNEFFHLVGLTDEAKKFADARNQAHGAK